MYNGDERFILGSIVIIYFLFLFGVSLYINFRSIKTYDDYNVAGRSVSIFPLILTFVGTAVGGSILLGFMENGYRFGMGQQWLNFGIFFAGIIMMFFFVKRIREYGEKYDMVTITDFTTLRFGKKAKIPTVVSVLIAYSSITGMQFVAIATILHLTIGFSMTAGIIISWIMLSIKTYFGGMKSVIWQDALHGTIQTVGVFVLFVAVIVFSGGWSEISNQAALVNETSHLSFFSISPTEVMVYLLTIGAYQFVRQDLWQRYWAAKDLKTASRGYWISILLSLLTGFFVIFIGVASKYGLSLEGIDPTLSYYAIIGEVFNFPMIIIMIIALLATVISTADSFLMAGASSIVNDLIKPRVKKENEKKLLPYSRLSVLLVSVFSLLLALYIPQLVDLWVAGTAMLVSGLLAPISFAFFWKRTTKRAGVVAMWAGLIVSMIWQILGHPFGLHPVFIGLPLSIILVVGITLLPNSNEQQTENAI